MLPMNESIYPENKYTLSSNTYKNVILYQREFYISQYFPHFHLVFIYSNTKYPVKKSLRITETVHFFKMAVKHTI